MIGETFGVGSQFLPSFLWVEMEEERNNFPTVGRTSVRAKVAIRGIKILAV